MIDSVVAITIVATEEAAEVMSTEEFTGAVTVATSITILVGMREGVAPLRNSKAEIITAGKTGKQKS